MTNESASKPPVAPTHPNHIVQKSSDVYRMWYLLDTETANRCLWLSSRYEISVTELTRRSIAVLAFLDACRAVRIRRLASDEAYPQSVSPSSYEYDFDAKDVKCNIAAELYEQLMSLANKYPLLTVSQIMRCAVRLYVDVHCLATNPEWLLETTNDGCEEWHTVSLPVLHEL